MDSSATKMFREKDVSTRLIRPTITEIHVDKLALFVERWNHDWEIDASIKVILKFYCFRIFV